MRNCRYREYTAAAARITAKQEIKIRFISGNGFAQMRSKVFEASSEKRYSVRVSLVLVFEVTFSFVRKIENQSIHTHGGAQRKTGQEKNAHDHQRVSAPFFAFQSGPAGKKIQERWNGQTQAHKKGEENWR